MSLQAEAGAGKGQAPLVLPVFRSSAIRAETPAAGGLRKLFGDEQIHRVRPAGSASTPRIDSTSLGVAQGSAIDCPGLARNTTPLMLPT